MRRALVFAIALIALAVGSVDLAYAGGCATKAGTSEGTGVEVKVATCGFSPTIIHAPIGAKVTWFNGDYLPHAINGLGWDATDPFAPAYPGTNVSHTFAQAGIYPYMGYVHPGMAGIVVAGDVAFNPNADGGMRTDAFAATNATNATTAAISRAEASAATVELPIAIALVAIAGVVGYAFGARPRYRWLDGALAIRRRHGVHAR